MRIVLIFFTSKDLMEDFTMSEKNTAMTQRQQQAAETRQKIYLTTTTLYQTKPYDSVTIADICEAADISVGSFYHYFKDKDEVFNEGFRVLTQIYQERTKDVSLPPVEHLLFLLRIISECNEKRGYRFMAASLHNEVLHLKPYVNNPDRPIYQDIYKDLVKAFDCGALSGGDPDVVSCDLVRVMKGTLYDWVVREGCFSLPTEVDRMAKMVLAPYRTGQD